MRLIFHPIAYFGPELWSKVTIRSLGYLPSADRALRLWRLRTVRTIKESCQSTHVYFLRVETTLGPQLDTPSYARRTEGLSGQNRTRHRTLTRPSPQHNESSRRTVAIFSSSNLGVTWNPHIQCTPSHFFSWCQRSHKLSNNANRTSYNFCIGSVGGGIGKKKNYQWS